MKTISTPHGAINLLPPPNELLKTISYLMPFGFAAFNEPGKDQRTFGLVMQCGEQEVFAVKAQPADCDEKTGENNFRVNSLLIAASAAAYRAHGFEGLLLPCAYFRAKGSGRAEAGVAVFAFPQNEPSIPAPDAVFDDRLGPGFTAMMMAFLKAYGQSVQNLVGHSVTVIGFDVRPRLQLGTLALNVMIVGTQILCLRQTLDEEDPVWGILAQSGVREMFHLPSTSIAIDQDQLHPAKREAAAVLAKRLSKRN